MENRNGHERNGDVTEDEPIVGGITMTQLELHEYIDSLSTKVIRMPDGEIIETRSLGYYSPGSEDETGITDDDARRRDRVIELTRKSAPAHRQRLIDVGLIGADGKLIDHSS